MKKITGILLCLILLGYGLVRIGVGGSLLAQELAWIHFPDLADALAEMKVFFEAGSGNSYCPFTWRFTTATSSGWGWY